MGSLLDIPAAQIFEKNTFKKQKYPVSLWISWFNSAESIVP